MRPTPKVLTLLVFAVTAVSCKPDVQPSQESGTKKAKAEIPAEQDPQAARPELYIAQAKFDAGKVTQGATIKHTFVVKNRGLGQLNIEKVQGS